MNWGTVNCPRGADKKQCQIPTWGVGTPGGVGVGHEIDKCITAEDMELEMIQHRAARFVLNQPWRRNVRDSISSLLSSLKWPTLQLRRESIRLILLHTIINNILQIPTNYLPTPSPITTTRSRNDMKFLHYQPTIDCFKYSFFPRTIPEWNQLPSDIAHAD